MNVNREHEFGFGCMHGETGIFLAKPSLGDAVASPYDRPNQTGLLV